MLDAVLLENALSLALDVLEGHEDARKILADLVEESGNLRAAELARSPEDDDATRLSIVLGILPSRAVLVLGADFVDHILSREPDEFSGRHPYIYALKRLRAWCYREIEFFPTWQVILFESSTQRDVRHAGFQRSSGNTRWNLGTALKHLAEGIRAVLAEYGKAPTGDDAWFDKIGLADVHVRQAAEAARLQAASPSAREKTFTMATELDWQVERTRQFLIQTCDLLTG